MSLVIDFADTVDGDPPPGTPMLMRVVRWHGLDLGLYTHEFGPFPERGNQDHLRYLGQISALQSALATDQGRQLVRPNPTGELIPQTDELPPWDVHEIGPVMLDDQPARAWATVVRGASAVMGDPRHAPFVLIYSTRHNLSDLPKLTTRLAHGG